MLQFSSPYTPFRKLHVLCRTGSLTQASSSNARPAYRQIPGRFLPAVNMTIDTARWKHQGKVQADPSRVIYKSKPYRPTRSADFKEIYRFKLITFTRLITAAKVYQTALTIIGAPVAIYLQSVGVLSMLGCTVFCSLTAFACVMLYIMSVFSQRIACIIYLNKKSQEVEISHLTFWGRRQDARLNVTDIQPVSDTTEKMTSTYLRLKTYNKGPPFYLFLSIFGQVSDADVFKSVLGIRSELKL